MSQAESQAQELSNELQDYESRRKEQHSSSSSALRDSENRFHVEEKLKGELSRLRHQVCYIYNMSNTSVYDISVYSIVCDMYTLVLYICTLILYT